MRENKLDELLEYLGINEKIENPDMLADFIKKIIKLVPINKPDKLKHAYELISHMEGLLHGDHLWQYLSKEYHSEPAKEGISNLIQHAQAQTIASLKKEKDILEQEIANLKSQKVNIESILNSLQLQINELSKEQERNKQNNDDLIKQRQQLEEIVSTLKESLATYEKQISVKKLNRQEVNWEIIDETHSIYNATSTTIDGIINGLILEYQNKLGCSYDSAKSAFITNCPEIFSIRDPLISFDYYNTEASSIMQIITTKHSDTYFARRANILAAILKTLKLPKYQKESLNIPLIPETSEIPKSMNILFREMNLQTQTLNALAAKYIAEQNLQIVINILKQFIPSDFDLDKYLINMNQPDSIKALKKDCNQ